MRLFCLVVFAVVLGIAASILDCLAETRVLTSEASYTMGDGESPSFAEAQVLQKAKQAALEQAGTYVEAYTKIQNYDLTKDEIQMLVGGVLTVEVLERTRTMVGEGLRFYIRIKATVTTDKMEELAQRIRGKNVAAEYKTLQDEYARLSRELETWKQAANEATAGPTRQTALERIKNNEKDFARVQINEAALLRRLEADSFLLDRIKNIDVEGVTQALNDGANPNIIDDTSKLTAFDALVLHGYTSERENHKSEEATIIAIANVLFEHGGKLSALYDNDILFFPIARGWDKLTDLLIKHGANTRNKIEGRSPMEWAIHYNKPNIAAVLRTHGIRDVDTAKASLLRFIRAAEQSDIAEMTRLRREGRIDVNAKDERDQTALIVVLRNPIYDEEQYSTIKLLFSFGADPNLTGASQFRGIEGIPIHLAVAENTFTLNKPHRDSKRLAILVIEEILKQGGKVAHSDSTGRTALHIAAKYDNFVAAEILVAHGATVMPRDNSGKTPLDYAESEKMIKFLKSHGASELNR
ncbi:MAG: ankyrin repeat domain-containing protein [Nitrospira sp.]|nr:ankyrin repeat domain-containing protein [Nitrospira sp.]